MFMENILLSGKTNFFERRVGDYQRAGVMNNASTGYRGAFRKTWFTKVDF